MKRLVENQIGFAFSLYTLILILVCLELQIKRFEKLESSDERKKLAKEIYDNFIMKELLSHTHVSILLECQV